MEEWRPIPGIEGFEVSNLGRVRKLTYGILKHDYSGRQQDYPRVTIHAKRELGFTRRFQVHVLVAKAFIGECPPGYHHNHKNGIKTDNRPENLEFVTPSQNHKHKYDVLNSPRQQGMKHGRHKLTDTEVVAIRSMAANKVKIQDIADAFGVSIGTVSMIKNGKIWRHLLTAPHCRKPS